jgi:general stress protein YciG
MKQLEHTPSAPPDLWYVPDHMRRTVSAKSGRRGRPRTRGNPRVGAVAKAHRGFASMDRKKQREIASKGGKAAHQKGTAHEWTIEEAREAGRIGAKMAHRHRQMRPERSELSEGAAPVVPTIVAEH